jgi:hypothetical protein
LTRFPHGRGHFQAGNEVAKLLPGALDIGTREEWVFERVGGPLGARPATPGSRPSGARSRDSRGRGAGAGLEAGLLERQFELAMQLDAVHTVSREHGVGAPETLVEPEDMRSNLMLEFDRGAS